eukprot:CAMPEP_0195583218 /NCGR_PEP_ID=MMETSP0814-20130614/23696_1 /TAXON_ID=97485 /ORGANISM="Prymnesium parvum, Strain Texoma1" /LENGTH=72 /DNA_ID=CAMNT_0040720985 /DNA_START=421 /DNA_END=639 /DNA_ORIENTATION=+
MVPSHITRSELGKTRMAPTLSTSSPTVGMSSAAGLRHAASGTVQIRPAVHIVQNNELRQAADVGPIRTLSIA